jgi:hypothetical protein
MEERMYAAVLQLIQSTKTNVPFSQDISAY